MLPTEDSSKEREIAVVVVVVVGCNQVLQGKLEAART